MLGAPQAQRRSLRYVSGSLGRCVIAALRLAHAWALSPSVVRPNRLFAATVTAPTTTAIFILRALIAHCLGGGSSGAEHALLRGKWRLNVPGAAPKPGGHALLRAESSIATVSRTLRATLTGERDP